MKTSVVVLVLIAALSSAFVAAAEEVHCNNVSFMSRRCHQVFAKACAEKGRPEERCLRMMGYCHSCTDQYVRCKSAQQASKSNRGCAPCNEAYGACTASMTAFYIDRATD